MVKIGCDRLPGPPGTRPDPDTLYSETKDVQIADYHSTYTDVKQNEQAIKKCRHDKDVYVTESKIKLKLLQSRRSCK